MIFPLNPILMELLVLSLICQRDSYGYQISQQLKQVSNLKDSSLYPVLRRLADNGYVNVYDQQFQGRNRKYYQITDAGKRQQELLAQEWKDYAAVISQMIETNIQTAGGEADE